MSEDQKIQKYRKERNLYFQDNLSEKSSELPPRK